MKDRIKKCFGRAANSYKDSAYMQRKVADICSSNVSPASYKNVLDIGSGVGFLYESLKHKVSFENYVSLDLVYEMVKTQQSYGCDLVVADGENVPFRESTFDLLVSSSAMQWYDNPEKSLASNFKLLKPGGFFSIAIFTDGTLKELKESSYKTGFGSVKNLKKNSFYTKIFTQMDFLEASFETKSYKLVYKSVKDFLKAHKGTGAVATSSSVLWGKERYKAFIDEYEKQYSCDEGIMASYSIFYAHGFKK